ncbi:uncharacterized protein LOC119184211 isoform X4 [Rhipicephalus microplus]|uniref:uncharacterized protein LOC119184211 isoform X4 n=1 Tax=Rhipicephalus microplus TaxID=6941 RepID=UPI003F6D111E
MYRLQCGFTKIADLDKHFREANRTKVVKFVSQVYNVELTTEDEDARVTAKCISRVLRDNTVYDVCLEEYRPFLNTLNDTDCDYERRGFEGKVVLVERCDNVSNNDIILQAKSAKANGILISVNARHAAEESKTSIKRLDITAGFIINETAHKIAKYDDHHNQSLVAKLFSVQTSFDWSFAVIWGIAMVTVVGGAYWSGLVQLVQYQPRVPKPKKKSRRATKSHRQASEGNVNNSPDRHNVRPGIGSSPSLLLGATRQPDQHWNVKLLTLLLSLLLVYDVFFVFITPLLRVNRESVMVEVAKGGSLQESLPMVVRFPRFVKGKYHACFPRKFSMLGLGDILAPGLLLSYCHAFDLLSLGRRFYFYISCFAYGAGMIVTFTALHLMHMAQPALLYLVPFTLVPTVVTAWYRGHLFAIWNGLRLPTAPPPIPAEVAEEKRSPPDNDHDKTPNHSETEELLPEEPTDTSGKRRRKSRRRKRSRRTSESAAKSPRDGVKEVVTAEGDDVAHDAELLVAVERLIKPSPSALPPTPPPAGVEDIAGVRKRSPITATLHWQEPLFCAQGTKKVEVDDLPPKATASPFPPA